MFYIIVYHPFIEFTFVLLLPLEKRNNGKGRAHVFWGVEGEC